MSDLPLVPSNVKWTDGTFNTDKLDEITKLDNTFPLSWLKPPDVRLLVLLNHKGDEALASMARMHGILCAKHNTRSIYKIYGSMAWLNLQ